MSDKIYRVNVEPGKFPFPLSDGPEESRYLTWIRNHSNYMAVGGFLDYVRAAAILLRGIFINALVFLPMLIVFSVAAAWWHVADLFSFTKYSLVVAAIPVLLFPLLTPVYRIMGHRKRLQTGSDSTIRSRDLYEKSFGFLLLLVLAAVVFESISLFLGEFHELLRGPKLGSSEVSSFAAIAVAILASADKLLKVLGGVAKKIAMLVIAALGIGLPVLAVLLLADFVVFTQPSWEMEAWPVAATVVLAVLIGITFVLGFVTRIFTWKDTGKAFLLLVFVSLVSAGVFLLIDTAWDRLDEYDDSVLRALSEPAIDEQEKAEQLKFSEEFAKSPTGAFPMLINELKHHSSENASCETIPPNEQLSAPQIYSQNVADVCSLMTQARMAIEGAPPGKRGELSARRDELNERISHLRGFPAVQAGNHRELVRWLFSGERNAFLYSGEHCDEGHGSEGEHDENTQPTETNAMHGLAILEGNLNCLNHFLWEARHEIETRLKTVAYSPTAYASLYNSLELKDARKQGAFANGIYLLVFAGSLWLLTWVTVDVNLTSIHGLYRDRLASAFLVGEDTGGDVDVEKDLDLEEICRYEAGSTAPYHLINAALNMQGSSAIGIRDRNSDFFVFSKKFIGTARTGYCRSESMELVFPQMGLATAMAISAAAASPNMGRATNPALVAIMILLNIRMGYWMPNPGKLEGWLFKHKDVGGKQGGYSFDEVFAEELLEITRRREQLGNDPDRRFSEQDEHVGKRTAQHGLVGLAFSGGGIRSATLNLGIVQALDQRGVFDQVDYMSTVSGGGYLGSSISALMRRKVKTASEISGVASIEESAEGDKVLTVASKKRSRFFAKLFKSQDETREYRYAKYAHLAVEAGKPIKRGLRLLGSGIKASRDQQSVSAQFRWRVRPFALVREIFGRLDETHDHINVSDGGHIENLACIELLRRNCRYIIVGDGEADPLHHFNGMATLIRTARIDLGVHIDIKLDALRIDPKTGLSQRHWAIGKITYPGDSTPGFLLYLKSSLTGDEDEVIQEYRNAQPTFPHESTADQAFTEGQFEAYRSLGQHMAEHVFEKAAVSAVVAQKMSFADLEKWFEVLWNSAASGQAEDGSA